jgi:hypothetical protein
MPPIVAAQLICGGAIYLWRRDLSVAARFIAPNAQTTEHTEGGRKIA